MITGAEVWWYLGVGAVVGGTVVFVADRWQRISDRIDDWLMFPSAPERRRPAPRPTVRLVGGTGQIEGGASRIVGPVKGGVDAPVGLTPTLGNAARPTFEGHLHVGSNVHRIAQRAGEGTR